MGLKKYNSYLFFFFLFITSLCSAQRGIISGVLEDESGIPLPGVNVIVKGTTSSVQTDFDGNYSIECQVGDILLFTYIGMKTREAKVTLEMFGDQKLTQSKREEPVSNIINEAYSNALKTVIDSLSRSQDISENPLKYNKRNYYFDYDRIKNIKEDSNKIKVTYFRPDIFYKIGFNSSTSFQFVDKNNLPELQKTFVQGRPVNGSNQWFGPETDEMFSFGSTINALTFDGSNYLYDTNGRLINSVAGNQTLPYNNNLFKTSKILSNNLNLAISNNIHSINLNLRRKTQEDLFGIEKGNLTQIDFNYNFKSKHKVFFKSNTEINNQPNINGFYSNILLASYITPTSFENNQGYIFDDNMQRNFSPNHFNNPFWLLNLNRNRNRSTSILFGVKNKFNITDDLKLNTILSFNKEKDKINFALPINTVGFVSGYRSNKGYFKETLHGYLALKYKKFIDDFSNIEIESSIKYLDASLKYDLMELSDFSDLSFNNPSNGSFVSHKVKNNSIRLANEIKFDLDVDFDADITLKNNSIISSLQGNEVLLPAIQLYIDASQIFYTDWLNTFSIAVGIAKEAKESPLFYSNLSHNSLNITPEQSQSLLANNDLFNSKALDFETGTNFDIESNMRLFYNVVNIGINYYVSKTNNNIFPLLTNGAFELQNVASIKNRGLDASLEFNIGRSWNKFLYQPTFLFSRSRAKVLKLNDGRTSIPIAGFSNVSKNLIVGEQTGAIVGSTFLRDANGSVIMGNEGYPIVDSQNKIIGNTTPDFNLSMDNNFKIGKIKINFLIDYQKGGDVWSGTKNVLNYIGKSQESANLRETTNFIFNGVDQFGNTNTIPVDFANPNQDVMSNRWVRYGFDGVDEEAIVDGSFINLKSISLSYDFGKNNKDDLFRQFELSLYGFNLLSYTKASGVSPYSSLFNYTSGKGLDYFNTPLIKEIGFKINIKI